MKKLFINAPSFFLFIGLMILCWAQVEFAPTSYSYQATDYTDELNPVAETQCSSVENSIFHFAGNHSIPLSEGEDTTEIDKTEGKHLIVEPLAVIAVVFFTQPSLGDYTFLHPKSTHNKPLFVLFHSWKTHLSA